MNTYEEILKRVGADPKSPNKTSMNVANFIRTSENPLETANNIIVDLGGEKVDRVYDARNIAQVMVVDCVTKGKLFDPKESYGDGAFRAKKNRQHSPSVAANEDNIMEAAKAAKAAKASGKSPTVPKVKAVKAKDAAEKAEKGPTILKNGKERGSMRVAAMKIFLANKDKDNKIIVDLICKGLDIPKTNAYTHIYLCKQQLKKEEAADLKAKMAKQLHKEEAEAE